MPYIYIYIYCSYWCNTTYFITFLEEIIVRCSRKYLFLKYGRKMRANFLEMLEAAIFFQGFPCVNGWLFKTSFADILRNTPLLQCNSIYSVQETASGKCT